MISVAHSPDSDDLFLFWALRNNLIDTDGLEFCFTELDTQELNHRAEQGDFDLIAISAAAYPRIISDYLVMLMGASVGRDFGPTLVSKAPLSLSDLSHSRIGTPGETTTATTLLSHLIPTATRITFPISPINLIFDALDSGDIEAALLIHEGQMSYKQRGLHLVKDIGKWWYDEVKLPLPLGLNVIKRSLGTELISRISKLIENSILYSNTHREEVINGICAINRQQKPEFASPVQVSAYLERYANSDSIYLSKDCQLGLEKLLKPILDKTNKTIEYAPLNSTSIL